MIAIAAMASNRIIGLNDKLPWPKSKEDFAFFREKTLGKHIVVGRKTFATLPVLKDRTPHVVTSLHKIDYKKPRLHPDIEDAYIKWGRFHHVPADDLQLYLDGWGHSAYPESAKDFVCIGGAATYALCFPHCTSLFLTIWNFPAIGDTEMPEFEHLFPVREKIKDIEDGKGTIWEYQTAAVFSEKHPGVEVS